MLNSPASAGKNAQFLCSQAKVKLLSGLKIWKLPKYKKLMLQADLFVKIFNEFWKEASRYLFILVERFCRKNGCPYMYIGRKINYSLLPDSQFYLYYVLHL